MIVRGLRSLAVGLVVYASAGLGWGADAKLELVAKWGGRLKALAKMAETGKDPGYGRAAAGSLIREFLDSLSPGEHVCELFGRAFLLKAVFEAQLDQTEEAEWDFFMALSLFPSLELLDFSDFPKAGPVFADWVKAWRKRVELEEEDSRERSDGVPLEPHKGSCVPPVKKRPIAQPEYPEGVRWSRLSGSVQLSIVVDKYGLPRRPYFFHNCYMAPFFVAAAEAIRKWRYAPAACEGEAVESLGTVSINFRLTRH